MLTAGTGQKGLDDFEILDGNITSELVVKPRSKEPKTILETRRSLNDMTKQAICDLSVERYGVELNFRTEKKELITQYLELQDQEG